MAPAIDTMSSAAISSENQKSVKVLDELLQKLTISKTKDEATYAAENLATFINGPIEEAAVPTK
jgi:elongation factor 3